jgi:hypothetical protein
MTNSEINLDVAVKALNAGKLNSFEISFVKSIKDYNKHDLKKLSKRQYDVLRAIYNAFYNQF